MALTRLADLYYLILATVYAFIVCNSLIVPMLSLFPRLIAHGSLRSITVLFFFPPAYLSLCLS